MCGASWKRAWVREKEGREGEGGYEVVVGSANGTQYPGNRYAGDAASWLIPTGSDHGYFVSCAVLLQVKPGRNDDSIHQD